MTHFSWPIDGGIIGLYLLATMVLGIAVRRAVRRVEDFLVAGREMGLYLGIASLAATEFGIVTCMYTAQAGYSHGFAGATPGIAQAVAMLLVGLTGFCVRPLRDAGVLTLPELFENRFGPRVRWAAGLVIVLGGLLNMGVFLRIGGEFLLLVCGVDLGYLEVMMTALLVLVAVYTILGGMLSVLVTDWLQFIVMSVGLLVVTGLVLSDVGWSRLADTVAEARGHGGFNPVVGPDLGWPYIVFQGLVNLAAVLTWQTTIARVLSAKDTTTGLRVYTRTSFFFVCRFLIPGVWGIAALASLSPAAFEQLPPDLRHQQSLYAMPLYLATLVPPGMMGLLIAAMLAADMSTDSSYMLTWGGVIYNDLLAPFRRGRWPERRALLWNRMILALIGLFLLIFGLWYPLKGDVWSYLTVTGSIYLASMSVMLIACCYWRRANNWGAAGAILLGALFPIAFLILEQLPATKEFAASIGPHWSGIASFAAAAAAMVVGSLMKPKPLGN